MGKTHRKKLYNGSSSRQNIDQREIVLTSSPCDILLPLMQSAFAKILQVLIKIHHNYYCFLIKTV
jgi:hypothetical protein